ncbi:MAG: hypothetical protein IT385_10695 [Deltaproteobacteria bacterium]|nr:hypothetical protein [Deltaproteobacteria bacterium]
MKSCLSRSFALVWIVTACSAPGSGGNGAPNDLGRGEPTDAEAHDAVEPQRAAPGEVALTVFDAAEVAGVDLDPYDLTFSHRSDYASQLVRIWIGIANGEGREPLALRTSLFSAVTTHGHQYTASFGCTESFSLAAGGAHACELVVRLARGEELERVVYGASIAEARASARACVACGSECVDPLSDERGATPCGDQCSYTALDPDNCGRCGGSCVESGLFIMCEGGFCLEFLPRGYATCDKACADVGKRCDHGVLMAGMSTDLEFDCATPGAEVQVEDDYAELGCACIP